MSNSQLVNYVKISPNKTSPRNHVIDTITIHCMAGNMKIESCGYMFEQSSRAASSNYGIGSDGRIAMYVEEKDRSWCSSNRANDHRAITIEVANDGGAETGWHVSDRAMISLIELCVDICKRNNIKELKWKADKNLIGQVDKQNMTVHRWFAAKECPGDYLYSKHSYIASEVNKRLNKNNVSAKVKIDMSIEQIYKYFKSKGLTDAGVAGLLGNLDAESGIRANNMQNSYEKQLGLTDITYTAYMQYEIDENRLGTFYNDKVGYGIAQWTFWSRKKELAEFSISVGHTIDSMQMQVGFLYKELTTKYKHVLNVLKSSNDVKQCSDCVLTQFEKPLNQSEEVKAVRYKKSLNYYNKYASNKLNKDVPFLVKVDISNLIIRKGSGTNYAKYGYIPKGTYTIVDVQQGQGSRLGWGKLKSGLGWISLDYVIIK